MSTWNHLVYFVIVLWVILKDLWLLFVIEGPYELVNTKVFSPFFAVYEPGSLLSARSHFSELR